MKVSSTSLSLPPTFPSSPLSSYFSTPYSLTPLSFFHPSLKARLFVLDTLLHRLTFFPSLFLPLSSAPLLSSSPFPCLSLPFPLSPFSLPFLLPPPVLGWYWHQARDASGGGDSLCLSRGHGSGDDHRAWFWRTKVHAGHDAKGERRACPLNPWPDPYLLLSAILLG